MTTSLVRALTAALLLASGLQAQTPPGQAAHVARIERGLRPSPATRGAPPVTIEERMKALGVPAVSVAVIDSGRIVWAKAYGVLDTASKRPATPDTRFQAASMSKPVASMAALRMVQEGTLSLDTDINGALRSWKLPSNALTTATPVTLRLLLTHTGGLTVHGFPGYNPSVPLPTVPQILTGGSPANTAAVRVDTAPGTIWRYSGGGMTVAQLLMSDVSGEAFPSLVRRLVLAPAGMNASGYEQPLPDSIVPLAAWGHRTNGMAVPGNWHNYPEMMAAGLWTTPSDLGRWIIEVQRAYAGTSSRVLNQQSARAMLTPGLGNWGLGVQIAGAGDSLRFTHGGSNAGFKGTFVGYVAGGRGVVVMTNGDRGSTVASEIVAAVGREYDWPGLRELRERNESPPRRYDEGQRMK
jgi:CubicO group peptidase (beta-lactamase class C family)